MTDPQRPIEVSITLDPAHPSLDHHRPGGEPLYGTAMSIDTLATTVARHVGRPDASPEIVDVEVLHPWILKAGMEPVIRARLEDPTADDGEAACSTSLFSPRSGDGAETHLRSRFKFGPSSTSANIFETAPPTLGGVEVSADQIYSVFFHGPAFQLVAGVQAAGDHVRSRMASTAHTRQLPERARLIEFALQTAGLWELRSSGRMMIPHAIRRIIKFKSISGNDEERVFAVARRGASQAFRGEIDVDVFDSPTNRILSIEGYQTVPLPFASDTRSAANLGEMLAQTSVGASCSSSAL